MKPEIRKDYIQEKYVIIAPKRGQRPHDVERPQRLTPVKKSECVFCPERIDKIAKVIITEAATKEKNEPWAIKVVANKFPAVKTDNPKAYGRQEVVVETPDHQKEIEDLSIERIAKIFEIDRKSTRLNSSH